MSRLPSSKSETRAAAARSRPTFDTPVEIKMVDGTLHRGRIHDFSRRLPNLLLEHTVDTRRKKVQIAAERIAYVAFKKKLGADFLEPPTDTMAELKIHLTGGQTFVVMADPAHLNDTLGFFGHPIDQRSPFREIYFYASAVNAKENAAALGSLLLEDGALDPSQLNQAIRRQEGERKIPIGQILVQHEKVSPEAVNEAQKLQARKRLRLGEVLVDLGMVSNEDIEHALKEQKNRRGKRIGELLVELGVLQESALFRTLARKFHMPYVDLDEIAIDPTAFKAVKREVIEKYKILPLAHSSSQLTIAIGDPLQTEIYDILRFNGNLRIQEVLTNPSQLERYIEDALQHRGGGEVNAIVQALETQSANFAEGLKQDVEFKESDNKVVQLANQIIIDAWRQGVSDIHVEPNGRERNTLIRFRVDGECSIYQTIPAAFRSSLVARLKIMAELDISERRKPQDGKIKFGMGNHKIELRVATIPTANDNEDVVMRILASSKPMPLNKAGMSPRNVKSFMEAIKRPYGLVLCVGPTGSGKTTTLHSALGHINDVERKIWTAEDPVEITQPGLRQVQVRPRIGYTFAAAMRAFLRADPDVIMIGEMRDLETASIAIEASLTGHLVFSTLHTNTAPETVTRLLDIGLDPFTFADALQCVLAQRLARSLCLQCRYPTEASDEDFQLVVERYGQDALRKNIGVVKREDLRLWAARGCPACRNTGFKGRIAIHELLLSNEQIKSSIQNKDTAEEIRFLAMQEGMTTLLQDGIEKAVAGKTALKQVLAVCSR